MTKYLYDAKKDEYVDSTVVVRELANGEIESNLVPMFILPQQEGKLLVAYSNQEELVLRRYTTSGSLDMTYGIEGTTYTGIFALLSKGIQEINGDFNLVGSIKNNTSMLLSKHKSTGERKFNFGNEWFHQFDFDESNYDETPSQILVQTDGK
ncbi:MAG: hypothetical protein SGJ00_05960 [bacterium]|nr:hypothetical protein [bacterium]